MSNNKAEYETALAGLQMAITPGVTGLEFSATPPWWSTKSTGNTSQEMLGCRIPIARSRIEVQNPPMRLQMGPRSENNHADSLANLGVATEFQFRQKIPVEHIANPSVQQPIGEVLRLDIPHRVEGPHHCLSENRALPDNRAEARKLQHLATMWPFLGDILFKKSCFRLQSDPCLR